jgi:predicted nuclease with TOPRIM domain
MEQLKKLITQMRDMLKTTATRANETLKTLPPLEQYEKTSPIYAALQNTGYALDFIERTALDLNNQLDAIDPERSAKELEDAAIEAGLKAGDLLRKSDFDAKLKAGEFMTKEDAQAAADTAVKTCETRIREELKTVEARRTEISTAKGDQPALVSQDIAARISFEVLKSDDYKEKVGKIAARLKELNELGVEVPKLLNAAVETPVDDAGEAQFSERLSDIRDVAG